MGSFQTSPTPQGSPGPNNVGEAIALWHEDMNGQIKELKNIESQINDLKSLLNSHDANMLNEICRTGFDQKQVIATSDGGVQTKAEMLNKIKDLEQQYETKQFYINKNINIIQNSLTKK